MMDHIPFGSKLLMSWVILLRGKNTLGMLVSHDVKMLNLIELVLSRMRFILETVSFQFTNHEFND